MEMSRLNDIVLSLEKAGYQMYSRMLSAYMGVEKSNKKKVAIIGDGLAGKSTFINWIIGKDVLPTGVLPSETVFNIGFGDVEQVRNEKDEIVESSILKKKRLDNTLLNVDIISSTFDKNFVISELPNLITKTTAEDIVAMSEIYECDAVVLVMTAERLLSESEQIFIKNYIDFVGENRLLIAINKINTLPEYEINRVLDYFSSHKNSNFPNVPCLLMGNVKKEGFYSTREDVVSIFREWCETEKPIQGIIDNIVSVIKVELEKKKKEYLEEDSLNEVELENKRKLLLDRKKLQEVTVEKSIIEFQRKKNKAVEAISELQSSNFLQIDNSIRQAFLRSDNPEEWYRDELQKYWKKASKEMCTEIDGVVTKILEEDITWLNNVLNTEILTVSTSMDMHEYNLTILNSIVNYNKAKKIVPFGIAGSVVIGFCLFRIIGAVVCGGIGSLLYSTIRYKSNMQREIIIKNLHDNIMEISRHARKLSSDKINKIYEEVLERFRIEANEIVNDNYSTSICENDELELKIAKLNELIIMMEG